MSHTTCLHCCLLAFLKIYQNTASKAVASQNTDSKAVAHDESILQTSIYLSNEPCIRGEKHKTQAKMVRGCSRVRHGCNRPGAFTGLDSKRHQGQKVWPLDMPSTLRPIGHASLRRNSRQTSNSAARLWKRVLQVLQLWHDLLIIHHAYGNTQPDI